MITGFILHGTAPPTLPFPDEQNQKIETIMKLALIPAIALMGFAASAHAAGPADLIRLYEEEILAHDLYVALGEKFPDVMPLRNIPHSERRHRDALAAVLEAEGIALPDPPAGRRFASDGLDELFTQWLADGGKSATAACLAGVRLEDHDIADLRKARIDFPKHAEVFAQLEAASGNHLRAFHRNLNARGGNYTPEALPAADFKQILDDTHRGAGGCNAACGKTQNRGAAGNGRRNGNGWRGGR
jgi:hypothetical protein